MADFEYLFFDLLQVAIGNKKTLCVVPTMEQWADLFVLSRKHALLAVAFRGISLLKASGSKNQPPHLNLNIEEQLYLKWLGLTVKNAQRNKKLNTECAKICENLEHDGFKTIVLKGQSNIEYYPEELKDCRTSGDIDVWVRLSKGIVIPSGDDKHTDNVIYYGKTAVVEYARLSAQVLDLCDELTVRYHHVALPTQSNIDVEAHFMPMYLNNPLLNRRLQDFFEIYGEPIECKLAEGLIIPIGTISFNAVYQLTHIYKHLFEEGIGLRQLLDYYMVLRVLHNEQGMIADRAQSSELQSISVLSNSEIQQILKQCGLFDFAGAVMYVQRVVFAMPTEYIICEPDEKRGKHLLDEIMQAGNFGKYDLRKGNLNGESSLHKFLRKTKRNLALAKFYPYEALWEPWFRVYHWIWRRFELWRW